MNCENVIILTNIVRNSFRIGSPEASSDRDYSHIVRTMNIGYGLSHDKILDIVRTQMKDAVKKVSSYDYDTPAEKYRRRHWVITQAKRWGLGCVEVNRIWSQSVNKTWLPVEEAA